MRSSEKAAIELINFFSQLNEQNVSPNIKQNGFSSQSFAFTNKESLNNRKDAVCAQTINY